MVGAVVVRARSFNPNRRLFWKLLLNYRFNDLGQLCHGMILVPRIEGFSRDELIVNSRHLHVQVCDVIDMNIRPLLGPAEDL